MSNPYATPASDLSEDDFGAATYVPAVLSLHGRIGRLRWFAYSAGVTMLVSFVVGGIMGGLIAARPEAAALMPISQWLPLLVVVVYSVRRLKDMDHGAGWIALILVPFLNFFFFLWLLFRAGTDGRNSYGAAPSPNTRALKICAWLMAGIPIVGIVAAIMIPAYQRDKAEINERGAAGQAVAPAYPQR